MCELRNVRLSKMSRPVQQNSVPCHVRPRVIPNEVSNEHLQDHPEIIIFPHGCTIIMIFERIQNTNDYTLLEFYRGFTWDFDLLDPILFTIPIPRSLENVEVLYSDLTEKCSELMVQRFVFILLYKF